MKQTILSAIAVIGLATGAVGQQLILDDGSNSGAGGTAATSSGLVYNANGTLFDGLHYNVGVTVWLGLTSSSLAVYQTFTPATDSKGYTGLDVGQFQLGTPQAYITVPGATGSTGSAWVELQMWDYDSPLSSGTYADYASAVLGNDPHATVIFSNPLSANGPPPTPPSELNGMPAVVLQVPEPATFALAGLGIASLLAFRRRS